MKRVIVAAALALIPIVAIHALTSAWKVSFTLPQSQYVLGEPIVGTIDFHNASSSCVPTPQLYGHFYLDQDPAPCRAWDAPPVEGVPPTPPPGASYGPPSSPKMEQPGATKSFPVNISLLCFERQARNPIGKHRLCLRDTRPNGLGELCVSFSVVAPTGIDAQAYQAFKGHPLKHPAELLKRFPTSTYAACAVYGIMHGFMQGDENMFLRSVERGTYLSNSYPDDTGKSKDGWRSLQGDAAAAWWSKWINIILTNHPDIWFADQLRLKRAVDQVALKNYQAGASDLEALSQEATPEIAQKAQKMLGMMRTKGWIKKEPPRSK